MQAPRDGIYALSIASDDGSRLWIGNDLIVDNDGLHGMSAKSGEVALKAGFHPIRVAWFNATGASGLEVSWSRPELARQPIPASVLFR